MLLKPAVEADSNQQVTMTVNCPAEPTPPARSMVLTILGVSQGMMITRTATTASRVTQANPAVMPNPDPTAMVGKAETPALETLKEAKAVTEQGLARAATEARGMAPAQAVTVAREERTEDAAATVVTVGNLEKVVKVALAAELVATGPTGPTGPTAEPAAKAETMADKAALAVTEVRPATVAKVAKAGATAALAEKAATEAQAEPAELGEPAVTTTPVMEAPAVTVVRAMVQARRVEPEEPVETETKEVAPAVTVASATAGLTVALEEAVETETEPEQAAAMVALGDPLAVAGVEEPVAVAELGAPPAIPVRAVLLPARFTAVEPADIDMININEI
ncbi:MAG: hypothetical protein ACI8Y8_002041 [Planctomycetota bacterium]